LKTAKIVAELPG